MACTMQLQWLGSKLRGSDQKSSEIRTLHISDLRPPINVNIEFKDIIMEVSTGFFKKRK